MKNIHVSIIVPVYNAEKYIRDTIDSLIIQSHKDIEVIIVDDGSTDSSAAICDSYKDPRIKVYHRNNEGLSASRQYGLDIATGDYVCTIDSDDYYDKFFVEKMVNCITENDADICLCSRYDFIDGTDKLSQIRLSCSAQTFQVNKDILSGNLFEIGAQYILSDSWNKLYKRQFIRDSNVRFELPKQYNGNDLAFNYKLVFHCPKIAIINEPLLYHRVVEGSMVHKRKEQMQKGFEIIINQISTEADLSNVACGSQLGKLYLKLLSQVVYNISFYSGSRYKELKEYMKAYRSFVSTHPGIIIRNESIDFKTIKQRLIVKYTADNRLLSLVCLSEYLYFENKLKQWIKRRA